MVYPSSTSLLEIVLDEPHVTIPEPIHQRPSRRRNHESGDPDDNRGVLKGQLIVRLAKKMRIKALSLILTGAAHTSFPVVLPLTPATHGKTIKKAPSATDSHYQHSFKFLTHTWPFFESKPKSVYTLDPGMHSFPFSVKIDPSLPCTFTTTTTAVHYQLTAILQPASFISFMQGSKISQSVIMLPSHNQAFLDAAHGFETSGYMRLQATPPAPEPLERISGEAYFPCKIFTQTGTIPVTISLTLVGEGTALTRISVELWESVYRLESDADPNVDRKPLDVRLASRQNCPLSAEWKASTLDAPSAITKRLLFKVPDLPVSTWNKNKDGYTAMPGRGVCHTSGEYLCSKIKIEHTLKLVLGYQYDVAFENDPVRSGQRPGAGENSQSEESLLTLEDAIEVEEQVMIVSYMDATEDHDAEPPCYYRSFTSVPVNPSHIQYIDAAIAHTLHSDPHDIDSEHVATVETQGRLPDYEECLESTSGDSSDSENSTRTNSVHSVGSMSFRDGFSLNSSTSSLGHFSVQESSHSSIYPPLRPISDIYQYRDLTSYIERYSRGEAPPVPF